MNELTQQIRDTLAWMKSDLDFRRAQTGLDSEKLSPEMEMAGELLSDLEAGRIDCRRASGNHAPLVYLASPYSHPNADLRTERFLAAVLATGRLIRQGHVVYSPVAHSHIIAHHCGIDPLAPLWYAQAEAMLRRSDEVRVLRHPKWEESRGVQAEIAIANQMGIPVEFVEP